MELKQVLYFTKKYCPSLVLENFKEKQNARHLDYCQEKPRPHDREGIIGGNRKRSQGETTIAPEDRGPRT